MALAEGMRAKTTPIKKQREKKKKRERGAGDARAVHMPNSSRELCPSRQIALALQKAQT